MSIERWHTGYYFNSSYPPILSFIFIERVLFIRKTINQNDGFIFFCLSYIMVIWLHWLKVQRFSVSAVECLILLAQYLCSKYHWFRYT